MKLNIVSFCCIIDYAYQNIYYKKDDIHREDACLILVYRLDELLRALQIILLTILS